MIDVKGLKKRFGRIQAVDGVSFTAPDGRVTGLLGPNGAGKSTTLRMISAVLKPDEGHAVVDGVDVHGDAMAARRRMGVLPHDPGLYPRLTARENIHYYGRVNGLNEKALKQRTNELIEQLAITEFADRRAHGYSHGQRVKVAIARALVHAPPNVLLDEPTTGLDVMATRSVRKLIRDLRTAGHCVLFSSHIMQEVAQLCDDIVIIAHGKVVAAGSPDKIRELTGKENLEDAFVEAIGSTEGLE